MTPELAATMAKDAIVFAMANPTPEIMPDLAKQARPRHRHGPQRLPEPGQQCAGVPRHLQGRTFRPRTGHQPPDEDGRREGHRRLIPEDELNEENILPKAFDPRVAPAVADAVAQAARESGVARV